ncbi:MAG: hypothetical protein JSV56_00800, partial [Methanomassiliicoccales archaeon]
HGRKSNGGEKLVSKEETLHEFDIKYNEIKEKFAIMSKQFRELTIQHTSNNELFYSLKRDLHLVQSEMDSLVKLRDQLRRE